MQDDIRELPAEPVPLHLRNAPTGLMADLGYGRGYQYAHDAPEAQVDQEHLPAALRGRTYYRPTERGQEKDLAARLSASGAEQRGAKPARRCAPAAQRTCRAAPAPSDTREAYGARAMGTSSGWAWCSAGVPASTRCRWPARPR